VPELPEVETLRRGLLKKALGRRITGVELRLPKLVRGMDSRRFVARLAGRRVLSIGRRGKYLLFKLDQGTLVLHLGMTGQLTYWDHRRKDSPIFLRHRHTGLQKTPTQHAPDKHTHLLLRLDHGDRLQYRDIRQFGHWRLLEGGQTHPGVERLGLEPLGPEYGWEAFEKALAPRRGKIKALLLSQRPVAGLGNIYADEALHLAGIRPDRRTETLRAQELRRLFEAIPAVLREGLRRGGTTFSDFRGADGRPGRGAEALKVYGRHGLKCLKCGVLLKKIMVSQRTTVYCPRCQK
jgi:formamidopyrimidine-DNA glycosylase